MSWEKIDWKTLERMRSVFLRGDPSQADYWKKESDLESYDQTFAQRIGWKWDFVLEDLKSRQWSPAPGAVLDWGCGSGVASRAFLDHFGAAGFNRLIVWDRSPLAMQYAVHKARQKYPGLAVGSGQGEGEAAAGLNVVISHVLTELTPQQINQLVEWARQATTILWVEPGAYVPSRVLMGLRDRLRDEFQVAAPCTHQQACGLLHPDCSDHWCHHFAAPPPEVFMDGDWSRFAALEGIDLRSLPLSCLVLDKRPVPPCVPGSVRLIGRPRMYKAHAQLLGCDGDGIHDSKLLRRTLPAEFRLARKGELASRMIWRQAEGEVRSLSRSAAEPPGA